MGTFEQLTAPWQNDEPPSELALMLQGIQECPEALEELE